MIDPTIKLTHTHNSVEFVLHSDKSMNELRDSLVEEDEDFIQIF